MKNFTKKEELLKWLQLPMVEAVFDEAYQCNSRDVFTAKLDNLYQETNNSLMVAVAGEIGNNAFDHNLGSWLDVAGVYFRHFNNEKIVVIADRGQGVRKTLSNIVPDIQTDKRAIEIAFTKTISGRSPEQRGNGLKFVAEAVKNNNWELFFQSGAGLVKIENVAMSFSESSKIINGCLAILEY
ncbi:hypothetical protein COT42_04040 [Candidatus Saganbacteria bacterium CG08_land_8_20_14_0_20_45_16]|uniref:Uncharacterized protein n=1 Tax=Candidatus Saganbacteria bacterium CG08_land_8_20_14_0_20_45_16 TaxID=2014293 RepID=A0A2H0XY75_UNCSA|nr:MAG: hypothetical protein COT42_04040 [Candidatus Saganbacteria bacterium CG08_land_8_20_14_0_20_45_16]